MYAVLTSKQPPRRTNDCEHRNITKRITNSATPVGLAQPPISPKSPGLMVNSHSLVVKFLLFITGSFTTIKAAKQVIFIMSKYFVN